MSLPENTRLLRTGELPPLGTRVYVPENTAAFVGDRPAPGWHTIRSTYDKDSAVAVTSVNDHLSWVLSHNLLVKDEARPTVGDRVAINAPGDKYHGMTGTLADDDGTDLPYWVRFEHGAAWFYPQQVRIVSDGDTFPGEEDTTTALVSVRHETTVILQRPVTASQLAVGADAIDPDWPVTVTVHPDRIEFHAHHEEPQNRR